MSEFLPVDEQIERIRRGTLDLVNEEELRQKLAESRKSGTPLRVKFGIDPSSPDIHIGHTVPLRKLRTFQDLGHLPVVIWGTATASVGDPTGKSKTRPQLTEAEVRENLATYKAQIGKVLDVERIEHRENGEWFSSMSFTDVIQLLARMTVARSIESDTVGKRLEAQQPVFLHELVYPLMQGWDSVEIECDVEIGGSDQLFNILVGRDMQAQKGQQPQICLTLPIIEGLDGVQKMSKSLGNAVGLTDAPKDMFGKLMSLPDELMEKYFLLLTDRSEEEIQKLLAGHPREAKVTLAKDLVTWLHDSGKADAAAEEFDRVFRDKGLPSEIPERCLPSEMLEGGTVPVFVAAAEVFSSSRGEMRRLVQQGGLRVNEEPVKELDARLGPGSYLIQAGKRRFCQVIVPGD